MIIVNTEADALAFGYIVNLIARNNIKATFIAKASYKLQPGLINEPFADEPDLLCGDIEFKASKGKGIYYNSDFAPFKPATDVLVQACAYAPNAQPVGSCQVGVKVGGVAKLLKAWGDRVWLNEADGRYRPSDPIPFTRLPVHYGNSYGGPSFDQNRDGKGHSDQIYGQGRHATENRQIPNIAEPNTTVSSLNQQMKPVGFGPLRYSDALRMSMTGTYDDSWLKNRWPWVPNDFQWNFFNAAPGDQQVDGYLSGNESVKILNMHRDHAQLNFRLPGKRIQLFLAQIGAKNGEELREVSMNLDTLWMDLEQEKITLVWRGVAAVQSNKLKEIEKAYLTCECLATPRRTLVEYAADLRELLEKEQNEDAAMDALEDRQSAATDAHFASSMATMEQGFVNMNREFDELQAEAAADKYGIPTAEQRSVVDGEKQLDTLIASTPYDTRGENKKVSNPTAKAPLEPDVQAELSALNAVADAEMVRMDREAIEANGTVDQPWSAESLQAYLKINHVLHDADLNGLKLVSFELAGVDLSGCRLHNCLIQDTDLTNATLKNVDFSATRLERTSLVGAHLDDAVFDDCMLEEVKLQQTKLNGTEFTNCTLEGICFKGSEGLFVDFFNITALNSDFSGCHISRSSFFDSDLSNANFNDAILDQCAFNSSTLTKSHFIQSKITNCQFADDTDVSEAQFISTDCSNTQWEACTCDSMEITDCILDGGRFEDCSLRQVELKGSSLIDCDLSNSYFEHSVLTNNNFLRASFEHTTMHSVDFGTSNLYQSSFLFASLKEVDLRKANTMLALIRQEQD